MPDRKLAHDAHQRQEVLLDKISRQFERLDDQLDELEADLIAQGWMADPAEERKRSKQASEQLPDDPTLAERKLPNKPR